MVVSKVIPLKSLGSTFTLVITDKIANAIRSLKRKGYEIPYEDPKGTIQGLTGHCVVNNKTKFYVIVKLHENLKDTLKILVHELYHVNQDILEFHDIKYKKGDANETYAYTLDYIFGEAYEHIIKQHRKKYETT